MIKNDKQYKISRKKLNNIDLLIDKAIASGQEAVGKQSTLASLKNSRSEIEQEIMAYESLKKDKQMALKERKLGDLPLLLIEYKIMLGLTQKEFSQKLGLKEQQLQRYEADNFRSVTFRNLLKFIQIIGLEVKIQETYIAK
jgi:DNA-binding Xre family transcriptional regulator